MVEMDKRASLLALLDWYRAMGVDQAISENPTNWLAKGNAAPGHGFALASAARAAAAPLPPVVREAPEAPKVHSPQSPLRPPPVPAAAPRRQFPTAVPDVAVTAARTAARNAANLDELATALAGFDGCSLKVTAKNLCFYRGAQQARVMFIGEAPGRDEDLEGKPFVGKAGQLLDKMLAAIQLSQQDVHITNIVYWRPPGNRTPTPQEAQVCRPFLERQVELVAPKLVVLLGGAAAKHILDVTDGILRIRGRTHEIEIGTVRARAIATLHPAYLLRTPTAKRLAWRDLLTIKALAD
jgi:uracil-DNA glycosylase family 4